MVVLGREQFYKERVGCCGMIRKDSIYPVGNYPDLNAFIEDANRVVEGFGKAGYFSVGDTYSVEHFEGEAGQNFRLEGRSIYLLELMSDGRWYFYENGVRKFSVANIQELKQKWREMT